MPLHPPSVPPLDAIIKLGGSVVTDKARDRVARPDSIRAIGAALRDATTSGGGRVILVHGTGSFGKPFANRYDYLEGHFDAGRVDQYLEIRNALDDLARIVARELGGAGLRVAELDAYHAFSLSATTIDAPPHGSAGSGSSASIDAVDTVRYTAPSHVDLLLARGVAPLFHGDLFVCARDGYRVVSSDEMIARLAHHYRPRLVLFLSDVAGVFRPGSGDLLTSLSEADADSFDRARRSDSDALDVSGGMRAKVRWAFEAARWADACWITNGFSPGAWLSALASDASSIRGTHIVVA
jgi:glutamate 5-kinase